MNKAAAVVLGLGLGLALAGASVPAQSQTTIFFPGTPVPPKHKPRPEMSEDARRELALKPLVMDGPPAATGGALAKGQAFAQVKVRHAITGVLGAQVKTQGLFGGGRTLEPGQAVYGVPMGGPDGVGMVWCAPRKGEGKGGAVKWAAVCLPFGDAKHVWVKAEPAMFPAGLAWYDPGGTNTNPPAVERRPVDLPPMTFSYVFGGADARGWLVIECRLDWGEGPSLLRSVALPPDAEGEVKLKLLGGEVVLRRSAEGADAVVQSPPQAGADIVF